MVWTSIFHVNKTSVLTMLDVNNTFLGAVRFSKSQESAHVKSLNNFFCTIQHKCSIIATLSWTFKTDIMQVRTHFCQNIFNLVTLNLIQYIYNVKKLI